MISAIPHMKDKAAVIRDEITSFRKEYFDVFSKQRVEAINQYRTLFKQSLAQEEGSGVQQALI
jgi:hypothetical protein